MCGKGRREVRTPLPQDAGDALLDYLNRARPKVGIRPIFLRAIAPYTPLRSISSVLRLGLDAPHSLMRPLTARVSSDIRRPPACCAPA